MYTSILIKNFKETHKQGQFILFYVMQKQLLGALQNVSPNVNKKEEIIYFIFVSNGNKNKNLIFSPI